MDGGPRDVLDLFSGVGGFSLGLDRAGFRTVAFCEREPFPRSILAKHWPGVPCYDDVCTLTSERMRSDGVPTPRLICGGFPCQDVSRAGAGAGLDGDRSGLWFQYLRIISECRPDWVVIENVKALAQRGLDRILSGLAGIGYDAEWQTVAAATVGAAHVRERVWVLAYPVLAGVEGPVLRGVIGFPGPEGWRGKEDLRVVTDRPFQPGRGWPQPLLRRVDDGFSGRVDRLKAIGNALHPSIPHAIGRCIRRYEAEKSEAEAA